MSTIHFQVYQDEANQYRWRLRAANGEPIASGEAYVKKADCLAVIDLVKGTNSATPVQDLTVARPFITLMGRGGASAGFGGSTLLTGADGISAGYAKLQGLARKR